MNRGTIHGNDRGENPWQVADGLELLLTGELLNLPALRTELELDAQAPWPQVLAAGWRRWSLGLLPRLDGIFSLAVRHGAELTLYRDRSGLRDLYWRPGPDGQIDVAARLGALPRPAGAKPRLARQALHEYLRLLEVAPPHTWLQAASALPPGQALRQTGVGPPVPLPLPGPPGHAAPAPDDLPSALAGLDARLQRSVATRLQDSARPAAFLSGGVDSALLCAIAARQRPDLVAVTVGFEGEAYDEAPVAQRVAQHLGLQHQVLRFGRADFLAAFAQLSRDSDQPLADPAAMATLLACRHCRSAFDVVLDGSGADEAVGLMPPRHLRLAVGQASLLPRPLRLGMARLLRTLPRLAGYAQVLDFDHPADLLSRWQGFRRAEIASLCGGPVSLSQSQFHQTFAQHPRRAHFARYTALLNAMTSDRLNQALALTEVPMRFPFWDGEVERYIRQLRTEHRSRPGQPKRILRALLASYLPAALWDGPKRGFNFPLREFLIGDDHALVRRFLAPAHWRTWQLLDPAQVDRLAQRFIAGETGVTFRVWALVVLGAWLEQRMDSLDFSA